ncbi:PTS system IIBC component [Salmonella bongori]|nr:PTS system IIBC component [Salmonella bongori]
MDKTAAFASDILRGIGGVKNIQRLENCMTRVRVEVQDDSQLDIPRLKTLPGVSGYIKQGAQHQLIVGPGKAAQVGGCDARPDCRRRRNAGCQRDRTYQIRSESEV